VDVEDEIPNEEMRMGSEEGREVMDMPSVVETGEREEPVMSGASLILRRPTG
jgi:hypothetical protein